MIEIFKTFNDNALSIPKRNIASQNYYTNPRNCHTLASPPLHPQYNPHRALTLKRVSLCRLSVSDETRRRAPSRSRVNGNICISNESSIGKWESGVIKRAERAVEIRFLYLHPRVMWMIVVFVVVALGSGCGIVEFH